MTKAVSTVEKMKSLSMMYDDEEDDFCQHDLLVSRMLLAQSQSKYVADEKAKTGQIVGSLEFDLLAKKGEKIEIIPFHRNKSFRLFKKKPGGGSPDFIAEVPYDINTAKWEASRAKEVEWDYTNLDGKQVTENLQCFLGWNYYCLLTNQIESLPRVITFSSTSLMAGKKLGTFALEAKKTGLPLPFKTYLIGTEFVSSDKGNYYKFTVDRSRDTTEKELTYVKEWAALAKAGDIKVDEAADNASVQKAENTEVDTEEF